MKSDAYIENLVELAIEDGMDYGGKFAGVWFFSS